jgi:NTP pyrophosphatase (non-canonical NTP hydrolase)
MQFYEYQEAATTTAVYPHRGELLGTLYAALGLANEAGEALGKIKKVIRDDNCVFTAEKLDAIEAELGDVLWYAAVLADELDLDLEVIAQRNLEKLRDRKARGVLKGSGDTR